MAQTKVTRRAATISARVASIAIAWELFINILMTIEPMLMFADWMVTVLPIILFLRRAAKALMKGVETWKKETMMKNVRKQKSSWSRSPNLMVLEKTTNHYLVVLLHCKMSRCLYHTTFTRRSYRCLLYLNFVRTYIETCSTVFWVLNSLQVPIAVSVTFFEAICLCKGTRVIASKGKEITNWKLHQIFLYCSCGIVAGMVGGLLGLGGGFILGPPFHELGIPPQVASATSTFAMLFSSSMSVVQYYLPN
ncbi:hypothetical protein L3X38_039251 [Prunus dulcis]|uniref:Sulfite exporter TauE/SafE family protein n=1 Tax=Prunus dulcis TaxID=3755 RepID=A0AAD4V7V5_PRUDU|nr:hypothetical protein L3X38_039251 [Prunus dulcis]